MSQACESQQPTQKASAEVNNEVSQAGSYEVTRVKGLHAVTFNASTYVSEVLEVTDAS